MSFSFPRKLLSALICLNLLIVQAIGQLQSIRQGHEAFGLFEAEDRFGTSVISGDFNNDGYGDVAAGAPDDKIGDSSLTSGFVAINYGRPQGVGWTSKQEVSSGVDGDVEFGASLASADFNGDGFDDLAVGAPGFHFDGRVYVYYGSAGGLVTGDPDIFDVTTFGFELDGLDFFGANMAAGYLEGDDYADLAIGAHGFDPSGAVFVLKGSASGLTKSGGSVIDGSTMPTPVPTNGSFGRAIAFGDLAGFDFEDMVVGSPGAIVDGQALNGMIHIIPGTDGATNLSPPASVAYTWNDVDPVNYKGETNSFGSSFAVGKFAGDNDFDTLAIGAPGVQTGRGRVVIAQGTFLGLNFLNYFSSISLGSPAGGPEASDFFGRVLTAADINGDGFDDLAIAAPGEDAENGEGIGTTFNVPDVGIVHFVYGSESGLDLSENDLFWHRYITRQLESDVDLGTSLATASITKGSFQSVLIGAPGAFDEAGEVIDYAPWRQPAAPQATSASVVGCDNIMIYALRPFEEVQIASTTKIMTVLLAIEATQLPPQNPNFRSINLEYPIEPWMQVGFPANTQCSVFGMPPNDSLSFQELIQTCIMVSGNDSAMAIADVMTGDINEWSGHDTTAPTFVQMMNDRASQLGMDDTLFTNPAGVDPGNPYSTAWDMQLLTRTALKNPLFRSIVRTSNVVVSHLVPNGLLPGFIQGNQNVSYNWLNGLRNWVPSAIGVKPGSTPLAGTTAVMAAPDPSAPNDPDRIVLANIFGYTGTDLLGGSRRQRMLQFGLDDCPIPPPPFVPPNTGLASNIPGIMPKPNFPFGVAIQLNFDDPVLERGQEPTDFNLVIQGTGARAAEGVAMRTNYRPLFEIHPEETITLEFDEVTGFDEIMIGNTEGQPEAHLDFEVITSATGGGTSAGLILPAIQKFNVEGMETSGLTFKLKNTGRESVIIALQFNGLAYEPKLGDSAPFRQTFPVRQSHIPIRANADTFLSRAEDPPTEDTLTIAFADPGTDFISYPPIRLTDLSREGRTIGLSWASEEGYFDGYIVRSSTNFDKPPKEWEALETVNPGANGTASWNGVTVPGTNQFFTVEGIIETGQE